MSDHFSDPLIPITASTSGVGDRHGDGPKREHNAGNGMKSSEPKRNPAHIAAGIGFVLLALITILFAYWRLRPYNDLWIQAPDGGEEIPVVSDLVYEGLPAVRSGGVLQIELDFCNNGVDVLSERWFEAHGTFSVFDADVDADPLGAIRLPDSQFFPDEPTCGTTVAEIVIPDYITPGIYSFTNRNSYKANPMRRVPVDYRTERFAVLTPEQE